MNSNNSLTTTDPEYIKPSKIARRGTLERILSNDNPADESIQSSSNELKEVKVLMNSIVGGKEETTKPKKSASFNNLDIPAELQPSDVTSRQNTWMKMKKASKSSLTSSTTSSIKIIDVYIEMFREMYLDFLDTPLAMRFIHFTESCQTKIGFWTIMIIIQLIATELIVYLVYERNQGSIEIYNLIHIILGSIGHLVLYCVLELQAEISTAITGHLLLKGTAPLSLVAMPRGKRVPEASSKLRFLIMVMAICYYIIVTLMSFYLDWKPIESFLPGLNNTGLYPCTPASYPNEFKLPKFDLGTFLQGDVSYATIYHYGLPLKDGFVGGFGSWPLYDVKDVQEFEVTSPGYLFAVNVICGKPKNVDPMLFNNSITGTHYKTGMTFQTPQLTFFSVDVTYPAFSHNWVGHENQSMQQNNKIRLVSGNGYLSTEMVVDEWHMIVLGRISNITVVDTEGISKTALYGNKYPNERASNQMFFGEFENVFLNSETAENYENVTRWIQSAFNQVMNGEYYSSQGALFSNIQSWATLPEGIYLIENTWKGVAAALSASAHFVLMQYDGTKTGSCHYSASIGAGVMRSKKSIFTSLVVAFGGIFAFLLVYQVLWWKISFSSTREVDLACQTLNLPLRLILGSSQDSPDWVKNDSPVSSCSQTRLLTNYAKTYLKFGELRETRKDDIGTLAIVADPKKVVHLVKGRKYI